MAFQSASRFGHSITLPFGPGRSYRIPSPPVDVGNFMVETTQIAGQRVALTIELGAFLDEIKDLPEDDPRRDGLMTSIEENQKLIASLAERLTVPDEMEKDYFRSVLGEAYDKMVENKEPYELVKLAASTVSVWIIRGREDAESFWNSGGRVDPPKAPQDRRRSKRATTSRSAGTSK